MKSGIEMIATERERQIVSEGYTIDHDNNHDVDELVSAAVAYAWNNVDMWPWELETWKPSEDINRNLVKAGALIAAAIDLNNQHIKA
jgi:hypothetical protein